MNNPALIPDNDEPGCNDFTLSEGHNNCWITVSGLSVYISRSNSSNLLIEVTKRGQECEEALSSLYIPYPGNSDEP